MDNECEHLRVILIGSDDRTNAGVRSVIDEEIDLKVTAEAQSYSEADSLIPAARPDVAVVDISSLADDGPDLMRALRSSFPEIQIVALTTSNDALIAEQALRAGALGFIVITSGFDMLPDAVRSVVRERAFVSRRIASKILTRIMQPEPDDPYASLSNREREILGLAGTHSTHEIAERLGLSQRTVQDYFRRIRTRLNLSSSRELIALARGREVSPKRNRMKKSPDEPSN